MYKYNLRERYDALNDAEKRDLRAKIKASGYSHFTLYSWFGITTDERRSIPGGALTAICAYFNILPEELLITQPQNISA